MPEQNERPESCTEDAPNKTALNHVMVIEEIVYQNWPHIKRVRFGLICNNCGLQTATYYIN